MASKDSGFKPLRLDYSELPSRKGKAMKLVLYLTLFCKRLFISILIWCFATVLAALLRYDGVVVSEKYFHVLIAGVISGFIWNIINLFFVSQIKYQGRVDTDEIILLTFTISVTTLIMFSVRILFGIPSLPRSIPILSGLVALIFQFSIRLLQNQLHKSDVFDRSKGDLTLIYGAGILGYHLSEQMLLKSDIYKPIGFLDDDTKKHKVKSFGLKIFGGLNKLEEVVQAYKIRYLVVAISQVSSEILIDLESRCQKLQVDLKIIPDPFKLLMRNQELLNITNISEEDLLGRRSVSPDESEISKFLQGKKILITGAGGSIGSEIARQVIRFSPQNVHFLDRNETALLQLELDLFGTGLFTNSGFILADIRDHSTIDLIIKNIKPDIIFHSAALKHLSMLEMYPDEAYKTNVLGTKNLLESSLKNNVKYFINISTDKAADPTSQLGKTKLLTERMIAGLSDMGGKYISVRFGNVVGSNGSFLSTFRYQISNDQPILITHPDITRYFMTIGEAVHLVLQSLLVGQNVQTLILDMGEPVSINQVALRMIKASGKKIAIKYSGLRAGEKLHEQLIGVAEKIEKGPHKDIVHTRVIPLKDGEI